MDGNGARGAPVMCIVRARKGGKRKEEEKVYVDCGTHFARPKMSVSHVVTFLCQRGKTEIHGFARGAHNRESKLAQL